MKTKICLLIALLLTLTVSPASAATKINSDGYYKGIRLAGKVKVVEAFPDNIGQWQFVEAFPDFTIQFVNAFPDIKIQYVNAFPGLP